MKKLLFLLSLTCLATTLIAQDDYRDKLGDKKGTKKNNAAAAALFAGGNLSTLTGDNASDNKSILGFRLGIGTPVLNFSESLGIRMELMYSQQGDKYSYGESGSYGFETMSRLNYVNLPVLARYQTSSGFYAEAGVQPGLLVSAKEKSKSSGMGGGETTTENIKKNLNSFSLGIPLGAGYVIKNKVSLSARVAPGLLNVNKSEGTYSALKERNFVLSARLSYLL